MSSLRGDGFSVPNMHGVRNRTMTKRLALLIVALLTPLQGFAQTVTLPQTVEVVRGRMFSVAITYDGDDFRYVVPPELDAFREYTTDPKEVKLRGVAYSDGMFRIIAVATKTVDGKAKLSDFQSCLVKVGGGIPQPPPPIIVPPDPPLDPPPTTPTELRVLMIYESDLPLPKTVYDAMFDPTTRAYLDRKCIKVGVTPEHRRFDEDDPLTNMPAPWKALRAALPAALPPYPEPNPRGYQVPHVAIGASSGAVLYTGPVTSDLLTTLKKYGGE